MMSYEVQDPAFTIRIAPERKLLEIEYRGYWDAATLQRYDAELRRKLSALRSCGCAHGEHVTILDMRSFPVQSQEMLAGLGAMTINPVFRSRRVAVVLSSALGKMQAKRTAPDYGMFDDREEAAAWLHGTGPDIG